MKTVVSEGDDPSYLDVVIFLLSPGLVLMIMWDLEHGPKFTLADRPQKLYPENFWEI